MAFYVESVDRPSRSGIVAEDIDVGTAVAFNSNDKFENLDADTYAKVDFAGVADFHHTGDAISVDEDDNSYGVFETADDDRASAWGDEDGGVIKLRTVKETNTGVTTAPNITNGDVVGVVDTSDADAPTSAGRIVEEGYTNDENDDATTTTFNRTNGNFIALGVADRDGSTSFDDPVRVEIKKEV